MATPLPNPKCFPEILGAINRAKSSVTVVNYIAEFTDRRGTDPVMELACAIAAAKNRGLRASVILEGSRLSDNYPFYRFLKDKGVDVWLDTSQTLIHHKVVVVDDDYIIAGSHNWSQAAFFRNEEFSIGTDCPVTISAFKKELKKISKQRDDLRAVETKDFVLLPENFVKEVLSPLFKAHAELAFNLYLILLLNDKGSPSPLTIDAIGWGKLLGFNVSKASDDTAEKYRRYYYKQRLNRVLGQLKKFSLIEVDRKKDTVIRKSVAASKIKLSPDFLNFGWQGRLSFSAKAFYFLSLDEASDSPFHPWWSESIVGITKKHGFANTIADGVRQLEDYNILEVLRAIPVKRGGYYSEEAHYYRTNPLYDMAGFEAKIAGIEGEFSKEIIAESISAAKSFWATHNIEAIKTIALLIKNSTSKKVSAAAKTISKLPATSSRRCLGHLIELVEKDNQCP